MQSFGNLNLQALNHVHVKTQLLYKVLKWNLELPPESMPQNNTTKLCSFRQKSITKGQTIPLKSS
jgi:hypothetical protein